MGYNFSSYIGVMGQLDYNSMGFNGATTSAQGVPGGDVHVFSASIDPIMHLTPKSHFDLYAIGGGGLYHWYQQFSAPASGVITPFASPDRSPHHPDFRGRVFSEQTRLECRDGYCVWDQMARQDFR